MEKYIFSQFRTAFPGVTFREGNLCFKRHLLVVILMLCSMGVWGQVNITPVRNDVAGFPAWTDTDIGGTTYLQLLKATSSAISPAMDFNAYTNETLNFIARTYGGTTPAEIILTVSISTNNGITWNVLGTRTPFDSNMIAQAPFDLSGYSGTQVKVKFSVGGTSNTIGVGIDDIAINGILPSCTSPTTQASTFTSSSIAKITATAGWTRGNGDNVLVVARAGSAVNADPVSGTAYSANAAFGSGTQIGTGNYVVYNGTGTSVNLSALTAGTTYYFAVYEYNTTGTCYNLTELTGDLTTTAEPGCTSIVSDGLNNSSTLFTLSGVSYYSGSSSASERPASTPRFSEGSHSYGKANGTATLTSSNIDTSNYTGNSLTFDLASFSGTSGNGADTGDYIRVEISPNGGTNWYNTLEVKGNNNNYWGFNSTGNAITAYDGDNTTVSFTSGTDPNGIAKITVTDLPATTNLKIRVTLLNDNIAEIWLVDNFNVCGTLDSSPRLTINTETLAFGTNCNGSSSAEQSFTIAGSNLTAGNISLAALLGYSYSETSGGTFTSTLSFSQPGGTLAAKTIYVKLTPTAPNATYNGNIVISGGGASGVNKAVTGNSTAISGAVVTNTANSVTGISATLRATSSTFSTCPSTTEKGFVYSVKSVNSTPINGGTGVTTSPNGTLGTSGSFTQGITGLTEGTTYAYQAYLFDGTNYIYGGYQDFTTPFTGTFNNVTATKACLGDDSGTISWTAATGSNITGYMVFAVIGSTTPSGTPTDGLSDYTNSNSNYASGSNNVLPATLGKLLYKGNGTFVNITGLTEDTNYSFLVLTYQDGGTIRRFSNGAAGGRALDVTAQDDVKTFTGTPSNNQVTLNWTYNGPTSCFDEVIIVANQGAVVFTPTADGSAYTANDVYTTSNQVVYKGSATSKAITGFTNGLQYCFKIFVRRGTTWSDGTSVCATPDISYCTSTGGTNNSGILNVTFNTINQTSTSTAGYTDYTTVTTTVNLGQDHELIVAVNTNGPYTSYVKAWIDWNRNGTFDTTEAYELGTVTNNTNGLPSASPFLITVPVNAVVGNVRMRIAANTDNIINGYSTSCQSFTYGEVEDYTITVTQPLDAEINVRGAGNNIPNGADTPYAFNNTIFATTPLNTDSPEKLFTIQNFGLADLNLTGTPVIKIEGTNASDFIITQQATTPVVNGTDVTFKIKFRPTIAGLRSANVRIDNNDSNENPYIFAIEGTGNCAIEPTVDMFPTSGPANTLVTFSSITSNLLGATVTYNNTTVPVTYQSAGTLEVLVPDNANDGNFIIQLATGCSKTQAFDVIDTDLTSCENSTGGGTNTSDLIIYEVYDEKAGSGGVITIFNRTGASVDLSNYSIERAGDYGGTYKNIANLNGTIAANTVAVIGVTITPNCGFATTGNGSFGQGFNDNDGFRLMKGATLIDDVHAPLYKGYYLKRKNTNLNPNTTYTASEWTTQAVISGQCLSGVGVAPLIKTAPSITADPNFAINCGITGTTLNVTGTEGVSGGFGLTYQWYVLGTSSSWTAVTNGGIYSGATTATLTISDITGIDEYQYYCQIRENSATCYTATKSTQIRIPEKTWDGTNWLGRGGVIAVAPTLTDKITLNANYSTTTNGNLNACSVINNNTYQLTITADHFAEIGGNIINNGSILIESDGNLMQKNDAATFTGNDLTAKRKITLSDARQQYNYLISPLLNVSLKDIYKDGSGNAVNVPFVLYFQESNNKFYNSTGAYIKGRALAVKEPLKGVTPNGYNPSTLNASFLGKPANGTFTFPIVNSNLTDPNNDRGFNLVGNPYPSNIDLITFFTLNGGTGGNLDPTFYFWDTKANSQSTQAGDSYEGQAYATFNALTPPNNGTGIAAAGDTGFGGTKIPTRYVRTGQGFMVKSLALSMDLTFNNTIRTQENGVTDFFGKGSMKAEIPVNRFWLNMISPTNIVSNIAIVYFPEGNNDFTKDDSRSMGGSDAVYSMVQSEKVSINGRNTFVNTDFIPLGSKHFTTGNYTITLGGKEGIFATAQDIYLKDKKLNIITNLSEGEYVFDVDPGIVDNRFEIVYKPGTVLGTEANTAENLQVYRSGENFIIQSSAKKITEVEVYDSSGRLYRKLLTNTLRVDLEASDIASGVYVLKIKMTDETVTKKIIK